MEKLGKRKKNVVKVGKRWEKIFFTIVPKNVFITFLEFS